MNEAEQGCPWLPSCNGGSTRVLPQNAVNEGTNKKEVTRVRLSVLSKKGPNE